MHGDDILKRAKRARREAEDAANDATLGWYNAKKIEIEAATDLSDEERKAAMRLLLMEFAQRSKRALSKAKRDNSPAKLMEREARADIESRRTT